MWPLKEVHTKKKNVGRCVVFIYQSKFKEKQIQVENKVEHWRRNNANNINISKRNDYGYVHRRENLINPTLSRVLYNQTKTLRDFALWLFLLYTAAENRQLLIESDTLQLPIVHELIISLHVQVGAMAS